MRNNVFRITAILIMILSVLALPFGIKANAEAAEGMPTEDSSMTPHSDSAGTEVENAVTENTVQNQENVDSNVPVDSSDSTDVAEPVLDGEQQVTESVDQEWNPGAVTVEELAHMVDELKQDNKTLRIYLYVCLGASGAAIILAVLATIVGARDPSRADVEIMDENLNKLQKAFRELHDKAGMSFQAIDQRLDDIERKI